MEGIGSILSSSSSSKPQFLNFNLYRSPPPPPLSSSGKCRFVSSISKQIRILLPCPRSFLRTSAFAVDEALEKSKTDSMSTSRDMLPKIDKSGRFCSPRAARELALLIVYAACLEGSDPVRLFEKRMIERREPGYEFDKNSLLEYNHMIFGGPPVTVETKEETDELLRNNEKESAMEACPSCVLRISEAEVLSAPPKLVYSKLILRFTRKLLVAVGDRWDSHVLVIPLTHYSLLRINKPAGRILELCILHMAMSEITVLGTQHQIVINEAVDLAKRYCDGAAPRIINGCLRTFVKDLEGTGVAQASEAKQKVFS